MTANSTWLKGPNFLWKPEVSATIPQGLDIEHDDPELKRGQSFSVSAKCVAASMLEHLEYFSDWHRAKRAIALCLRFKRMLQKRCVKRPQRVSTLDLSQYQPVSVNELQEAQFAKIKITQADSFHSELHTLKACKVYGAPSDRETVSDRHTSLKGKSDLRPIDPFMDSAGVIRVGGRIQNSKVSYAVKHPMVLPKRGHVTEMLVRHFHEKTLHQGRGMTVNEIRNCGFWIIGCSSIVINLIRNCVTCRRLRGTLQDQKMSNLPSDRLELSPPFTYCAVDFFGSFYIKEGRKELKRYGALFTCLMSRAVHVETSNTLETDSFINCLRRFIAIRGPIRQLRSYRGTNFVGAENELRMALNELDDQRIKHFLLKENCDCDVFQFKMFP